MVNFPGFFMVKIDSPCSIESVWKSRKMVKINL
jgi:hypothetical protein